MLKSLRIAVNFRLFPLALLHMLLCGWFVMKQFLYESKFGPSVVYFPNYKTYLLLTVSSVVLVAILVSMKTQESFNILQYTILCTLAFLLSGFVILFSGPIGLLLGLFPA